MQVTRLATEAERFAELVAATSLDAPIAACPGWNLGDLARHLGSVHRWARHAAATSERPAQFDVPAPAGAAELAAWIREGATVLVETLRGIDPAAPTWHPFPVARVAGVWPRRQAQETLVHRWDAEHAAGATTPIDPAFASDGIDEYFEMMLPRVIARDQPTLPTATLHVHCTDTHGEWFVRVVDGHLEMTREHAKGDAALRGSAEALLLHLWGRPVGADAVDVVGDPAAARAWTALGGV